MAITPALCMLHLGSWTEANIQSWTISKLVQLLNKDTIGKGTHIHNHIPLSSTTTRIQSLISKKLGEGLDMDNIDNHTHTYTHDSLPAPLHHSTHGNLDQQKASERA